MTLRKPGGRIENTLHLGKIVIVNSCVQRKKRYCTDAHATVIFLHQADHLKTCSLRFYTSALMVSIIYTSGSMAIEEEKIRSKLHTVFGLYLTPHEAFNMKKQRGDAVLLVDIRSRAELKYVGASPLIDANIPARFIHPDFSWSDKVSNYRTQPNDHFVEDFEKLLRIKNVNKNTPVILICQSGSRVPRAAATLHDAGFKQVYSQYQGFEGIKAKTGIFAGKRLVDGWKNAGLPWSYRLRKEAMYFNFDSTQP